MLTRTGINELTSDRSWIEIWGENDGGKQLLADVFVDSEESVRLADLFVAAPSLLSACKSALNYIVCCDEPPLEGMLRAAINVAEGSVEKSEDGDCQEQESEQVQL
jgi:hypothetical protein